MLRHTFYAILAGLFFSLAFPPKLLPGVEFIALVPFFFLLLLPLKNNQQLFFLGWAAGTASFIVYLRWFFDILPLNWAGIETSAFIIGAVAFTLFLAAGYFGLWFGLFLILIKKYALQNTRRFCLAVLLVWPSLEYLRTFFFSFHPFLQGPGWLWGAHAAFMLLGYTLAPYPPLRALASILGSYGISSVVLLPNVFIFLAILYGLEQRHGRTKAFAAESSSLKIFPFLGTLFAALVLFGFLLSLHPPQTSHTVKIALLQTAFAPEDPTTDIPTIEKRRHGKETIVRELVARALKDDMDIIVAPEGSPGMFAEPDFEAYPSFREIAGTLGRGHYRVAVDTGSPSRKWERHKNTTTVFDNRVGVLGTYQKQFLMPWGEYIPSMTAWISSLRSFSWDDVIVSYTPGDKPSVFQTQYGNIGILTCSEILSPPLAKKTARDGAEILFFSSSDSVLHDSKQLQEQNLAMAQIRAATVGKPLMYSANESRSFALDALGNILWESEKIQNQSVVIPVETNKERTLGMYLP